MSDLVLILLSLGSMSFPECQKTAIPNRATISEAKWLRQGKGKITRKSFP